MKHRFKAKIYKSGINWCVDVPAMITESMVPVKGYIRVTGTINNFGFSQTLVPVKSGPYRVFVNGSMMKGGKTRLGEIGDFAIEQDKHKITPDYPMPERVAETLAKENLEQAFELLSQSRKKEILKYFSLIKTEKAFLRKLSKLLVQLTEGRKDVRVP